MKTRGLTLCAREIASANAEKEERRDPHRLHGDELTLARQPAQPQKQGQQEGHGYGQGQEAREDVEDELADHRPGGALPDQEVGNVGQMGNEQDESEEDQPDQER